MFDWSSGILFTIMGGDFVEAPFWIFLYDLSTRRIKDLVSKFSQIAQAIRAAQRLEFSAL